MTALLLGLWARVQGWALAVAGVLVLLAMVHRRGRQEAQRDAALDDATTALRRRETRDEVDRDVAREPDAAGRLRGEWGRD